MLNQINLGRPVSGLFGFRFIGRTDEAGSYTAAVDLLGLSQIEWII